MDNLLSTSDFDQLDQRTESLSLWSSGVSSTQTDNLRRQKDKFSQEN